MFIVVLSDVFRMNYLCVFISVVVSRVFLCVFYLCGIFSAGVICVSIFFPRVFNVNWVGQIKVEGPEAFYYNKM